MVNLLNHLEYGKELFKHHPREWKWKSRSTQFYWIDAGSMDPIMQGNHEATIGLGYFLDRVELIQLHKERFHLYLS